MKTLLSLMLSGILLLFLSGCGQLASEQTAHNNSTAVPQVQRQLTYVAIGASDAFGIGTDDPYNESWPADLALKLGPNVHLINLGIPGILVHQALALELPIALDTQADRITIWLGVNDIAQGVAVRSYSSDLDLILTRLQAKAPHALIAVGNVPDLSVLPYFNDSIEVSQAQIAAYNMAIAAIVKRHHALLVDLYGYSSQLRDHPEYISNDGLHLNALGYSSLAGVFYSAFQRSHQE